MMASAVFREAPVSKGIVPMSLLDFSGLRASLWPGPHCRRGQARTQVDWRGRLTADHDSIVCWVEDLGVGGARLGVPHRLRGGGTPVLTIDGIGRFPCRIVWRGRGDYGVAFLEPPAELARHLGTWLPVGDAASAA